ncbi:MAG: methyltransferase type 12 [Gammaproteobacteria bacterium SG8_47]|nr:MAG: methyltransferase type 12 [Gammaproteobacteria bacterium SG8_47]
MQRIPEPELMDGADQARAYAEADFEAPHSMFIELLRQRLASPAPRGTVLDLGCGPADITLRFARAFPQTVLHGVDASASMLEHGRSAVERAHLAERVHLFPGYLPGAVLPHDGYDAIISNSLLHHLADPAVLWHEIRTRGRPGAAVFVMDLLRPETRAVALALRDEYATDEPAVLRNDFLNSLLAAYRPTEVREQLSAAGLQGLAVEGVSDRHFIVHGYLD